MPTSKRRRPTAARGLTRDAVREPDFPVLQRGATGEQVKRLQRALKTAGFSPGRIDGDFGGGTEAAVINFQRSNGLLDDGVVGPRTATALGLSRSDMLPDITPRVTVEMVSRMFPATLIDNIKTHLPTVLQGLRDADLGHRPMVLMALATIRAETEGFVPISEGISIHNTSPGASHPFDLYDARRDLGNRGQPDGERFRGRGFVQLTGRDNYRVHGAVIGVDLETNPELANRPDIASQLLASFLKAKERAVKEALLEDNLRQARKLVNGGSHGFDRFESAFRIGQGLLPER